jgi:hypothetical protein
MRETISGRHSGLPVDRERRFHHGEPSAYVGVAALPVSRTDSVWVVAIALLALDARGAPPQTPDKASAPDARGLSVQLRHSAGGCQAPGRGAYSPQRSKPARRPGQAEPGAISQHSLQPDAGIWRAEQVPFRLELLRAGYNLQSVAVTVSTVEDGMAQDVVATPAMFEMGPDAAASSQQGVPAAVGLSRSHPINSKKGLGRVSGVPGRELLPRRRPASAVRSVGPRPRHQHRRAERARNFRPSRIFGSSGPARAPTPS